MTDITPDEIYDRIEHRAQRGMTLRMLVAEMIDAHPDEFEDRSKARAALRSGLKALERSGRIVLGRGKRYFIAEAAATLSGVLRMQTAGFGLVRSGRPGDPPVRVERGGLRGALDGDTVLVRLETARKRARAEGQREGVVVRVLERARSEIVGRWVEDRGRPHVKPVDRRLKISVLVTAVAAEVEPPRHGDFVVVALDSVSERTGVARGRLVERLGAPGDAGLEDRVVLRLHGIEEEFPAEALAEAKAAARAGIGEAALAGRRDLRDRPTVTIDPEDARDYDDAVDAEPGDGGAITVYVHIADVGAFVPERSALDRAARERSTSVYLPGRAVPMLPEALSGDACSLRPEVDRLAFSVRYTVRPDGRLGKAKAWPSVIRSRRRCTYAEVAGWLEEEPEAWPAETAEFARSLAWCHEAARRLRRARHDAGSLDFDLAEPLLLLDDEGTVVSVRPAPRTEAHRMIEELMVAANRAVAEMLIAANQPALHRVHDRPDPKRLDDLAVSLASVGVEVDWDPAAVGVRDLQAVLAEVAGQPSERMVSMLVLRSLARAIYSPEPRGHYALATEAYAHFTSPIRRYPDLVVHRMLRRLLSEGRAVGEEERAALERRYTELGEHCSSREQRAEAAERMAVQWRTVRFLADKVGQVFEGRISGVTDFGLFVQLDEYAVDGLVHVSELVDDYYDFDAAGHRLVGERTRRDWRLGDAIKVQIVRIDEESMQVQLAPVGVRPDARAVRRPERKPRPSAKRGKPPKRGTRGGGRRR